MLGVYQLDTSGYCVVGMISLQKSLPPCDTGKNSGYDTAMATKKNRSPRPINPPAATADATPFTKDGIPKTVADRMMKRAVGFSSVPTLLGFLIFPAGYFLLKAGYTIPNWMVVFTSMGFLGLGVAGISYGLLSTPWLPSETGTFWGWKTFWENVQRLSTGLGKEGERIRAEKQASTKK